MSSENDPTNQDSPLSQAPKLETPTIGALDRDLKPLRVGDQIRFIMSGYFLPREQESFGKIRKIDEWGGITIEIAGVYRHFTSKGNVGEISNEIYFTHHRYDEKLKARVYEDDSSGHQLYISKVEEE